MWGKSLEADEVVAHAGVRAGTGIPALMHIRVCAAGEMTTQPHPRATLLAIANYSRCMEP